VRSGRAPFLQYLEMSSFIHSTVQECSTVRRGGKIGAALAVLKGSGVMTESLLLALALGNPGPG
jgi:hypothetical protein